MLELTACSPPFTEQLPTMRQTQRRGTCITSHLNIIVMSAMLSADNALAIIVSDYFLDAYWKDIVYGISALCQQFIYPKINSKLLFLILSPHTQWSLEPLERTRTITTLQFQKGTPPIFLHQPTVLAYTLPNPPSL